MSTQNKTPLQALVNQTFQSMDELASAAANLDQSYIILDAARLAGMTYVPFGSQQNFDAMKEICETHREVSREEAKSLEMKHGKYQYNYNSIPACSVSAEEIVVAWQTADYEEDAFCNIITNWLAKGRRDIILAVDQEDSSIEAQFKPGDTLKWTRPWSRDICTSNIRAVKFYLLEDVSLPYQLLHPVDYEPLDQAIDKVEKIMGFPDWLVMRKTAYLKRRVAKLRADHNIPLKYLRGRPSNVLGRWERLSILAKSLAS